MKDKIRPFDCGTQYADWQDANCCRCTKGYDEEKQEFRCDLEEAISMAAIDDGTVSQEVWERMGHKDGIPGPYCWQCSEWEPTEWWKEEWRRRHSEDAE